MCDCSLGVVVEGAKGQKVNDPYGVRSTEIMWDCGGGGLGK